MLLAPMIARNWPLANGSGRILDKYAKGINLGTGERTAETSDGFLINVLADDLIGRHIIMSGKFDRSVVQVLIDQAKPGDVLVDIGANIGYVSGCFLAKVPGSRAICVEPQPGIVALLRKNATYFGTRAEVHQVALSDSDGELRFQVNMANRGASKISEDGEAFVPAVEAGKFFRALERVDIIKIDVEGHEEPILRSIESELRRLKPRAIMYEDHTASPVIRDVLKSCGYTIYGIEKKLLKTRLVKDARSSDYIAL